MCFGKIKNMKLFITPNSIPLAMTQISTEKKAALTYKKITLKTEKFYDYRE